ncbi:transporter substrate-binding domain-containing protein [Catenovulum agarivorans]|uniref:transporter substrate-binding domain-containing protein n=1 Tax=Catenovulum agarivorans TaxID=1172192 RepID=UPI0003642FA6|nr:transporter substrate-binding domain-containing protein [Catenovulum agarivorans]
MQRTWAFGLVLVTYLISAVAISKSIVYPPPLGEWDKQHNYPITLLSKALKQVDQQYQLELYEQTVDQEQALNLLYRNQVDVVWTMTNKQREALYLPIRIPLTKGLSGWRLFLIKPEHQNLFDSVKNRNQLKLYTAVQGQDWPDEEILQRNQLKVVTKPAYADLIEVLTSGQAQYFPRGVFEIWSEAEQFQAQGHNVKVESSLALYYPTALYFFVNRNNSQLAATIESGLKQLLATGEFERMFNQAFADAIAKTQLEQRRILHLNNPSLPKQTPLANKQLWFQPK